MPIRRAQAHVGKESLEGLPFIANENAALAIIRIAGIVRVAASLDHVSPCGVFRRKAHAVSLAVVALCTALATGNARTISQGCAAHGLYGSALAATVPVANLGIAFVNRVRKINNAPAPILFVRQVNACHILKYNTSG